MNRVTLPLNYHNPNDDRPYFDWDDRVYKIRDAASIACITREIHDTHIAGESVGLVVFNHPHRDRYSNPILSMESDWPGVDLSTHRRIALWVGNKLNRAYNCQVQIVWSGNVSYHIHQPFHDHGRHPTKCRRVGI